MVGRGDDVFRRTAVVCLGDDSPHDPYCPSSGGNSWLYSACLAVRSTAITVLLRIRVALMQNHAATIYAYPKLQVLFKSEGSGGKKSALPGPGQKLATERPALKE